MTVRLLVAALLTLGLVPGCDGPRPETPSQAQPGPSRSSPAVDPGPGNVPPSTGPMASSGAAKHLIFVTIDTLRADRLGCYGNRDVETPHLDQLAKEGALAVDAMVHAPLTRPSHTSMLTGLYPDEHNLRDNISQPLASTIPTLAEVLQKAGFRTGAFLASPVLSAQSGLNRGFETYSDRFEAGSRGFLDTLEKPGDKVMAEAMRWLESQPPGRLFAWIHLYDPHDPYEPPEPYATRYKDRPYDGEVAWSDALLGRLDASLERLGIRDQALVVVTSDHGEGLGDHGENIHGFFVYQSTLHVPLLFRGPGIQPGRRLEATVGSVDLFPTFLDLLGVQAPAGSRFSGRNLAPALRGAPELPDQASYAECLEPLLDYGWSDLRTLREGRWKYILAPKPELYDLKADPRELKNLADQEPGQVSTLHRALTQRLAADNKPTGSQAGGVPSELLEKLGALGYIGAPLTVPGASRKDDPKDKLAEYKEVGPLIRDGKMRLGQKDFAGSAGQLQALLDRGIESFDIHFYLGGALMGLKRPKEAVGHLEAAIARLPGYVPAYPDLARARFASGDAPGAMEALHKGQALAPKEPGLFEMEGQLLRGMRKPQEALRAYDAALPLAPNDARLHGQAALVALELRDPQRAIALLRRALELDPGPAVYWNSLGMALGGTGKMEGAEKAFREAISRDPRNVQYLYNLGLALVQLGSRSDAVAIFQRALQIDPQFRPAAQRLVELGP